MRFDLWWQCQDCRFGTDDLVESVDHEVDFNHEVMRQEMLDVVED